jgi:hypothetical protein
MPARSATTAFSSSLRWTPRGAPLTLAALPAVAALRTVWRRHFEQEGGSDSSESPGRARLQAVRGRGGEDRLESPYDPEARYRSKDATEWTGYMVHLTETCDGDAPHLVVHADTTAANVHEAMRTEPIHAALAAKGSHPPGGRRLHQRGTPARGARDAQH